MQNCTIYSHKLAFDTVVNLITKALPKAKIETKDNGLQKSLNATIKGGFFSKSKTLKVNYRQRQNPSYKLDQVECGLTQNLAGMVNYIQALPSSKPEVKTKFIHKVMAANCEMAFIAEPDINQELGDLLRNIVKELDGFIFAQPNQFFNKSGGQHFVDKHLNLIIDGEGNCQVDDIDVVVDAKYHDQPAIEYKDDQLKRKSQSESFLEQHSIKVNKNLPCTPSESEVVLRSTSDVIDRAYALLIMGVKGEGVEQEYINRTIKDKNIDSFTPKESFINSQEVLNDDDKVYAIWRYESLYLLLWALGVIDDMKYPSDICNVQEVVGKIFTPSREEFESSIKLRSSKVILDELDKVYRMNWACVDARIKGQEPTGRLNGSVVYERHYALNWLIHYQNQDWDNVKTNT